MLFAHTSEAMVITDGRGRILDANSALLRLVGVSLETLRSSDPGDFLLGGSTENAGHRGERMAKGFNSGESVLKLPDGRLVPVQFWTVEIDLGNGQLRACIGINPTDESLNNEKMTQILRSHFDDSPDGKIAGNTEGQTIYANDRHLEIWGLTRADMTLPLPEREAKRRQRFVDQGPFDRMANEIAADPMALASCVATLVSGAIVEVRSNPLVDDRGVLIGRSFTTRDITEQESAKRELSSLATLFAALAANSPLGILAVDPEGKLIHCSDEFLRIWNLDASWRSLPLEAQIRTHRERFSEPELHRASLKRVLKAGVGDLEDEFETSDGRLVQRNMTPLVTESGLDLGRAFFYRDVTTARRAEAILRESEARYRTLVAELPVGVVMQNADGTISAANPAAERIIGLTEDQMKGLTAFDPRWRSVGEDGAEFPREQHPSVVTLRTGEPCHDVSIGIYHVSGALHWLNVSSEPIRDDAGRLSGVVVTFQDVTEQRQASEALSRARTAEAYQSLASGVAHKINNSLSTILGNAYLAGLPEDLPADSKESLLEIVEAATDATAMVRDLLALSGTERHARAQLSLFDAVRSAVETFDHTARADITMELSSDLPTILADATAISQAISAIIRNGLEAGGPVSVRAARMTFTPNPSGYSAPSRPPAGHYLAIVIRDNGPGLAEMMKSRLFEPFVTTRFVGRGLGLAATAGIMAMHHGFVELVSSPDGCTVTLLFPSP